MFEVLGKINDKKILLKAEKLLISLNNKESVPIKTLKINGLFYKAISVSLSYRLLFKRGTWYLMTHERYNKEMKK